jgi:DNA-binding transcriptional MerR regulator
LKQKNYLRISELAHLAKINTRTLHYYDDIGLFTPDRKDEHGHRYYSLKQAIDLGIILSLKELDMPLKEIKHVVHGNVGESKNLIEAKLDDVREKITQLQEIEFMLQNKLKNMSLAEQAVDVIQLVEMKEEPLLLSKKIDESDLQTQFEAGYQLIVEKGEYIFTNNEYGMLISSEKKRKDVEDERYDYFYLKTTRSNQDIFIKSAGLYASIVHKGKEEHLPSTYEKLLNECQDKGFKVEGYFYERALYETIEQNEQEYVTEIQVKVKR